jgi:NADPH-dependent glutamate synthase beta subunit-like oxidoreductase/CO/xanthine dehydrogenase FAD-binding subunit
MKTFQHYNARSLKHASAVISKHNGRAKVNAGGTELLGSLRNNCIAGYPEAVINIKTIPRLNYIKTAGKGLRIGALTTLADIVKSPEIRRNYALLAEAAHSVAAPNLRNLATMGGNLAQDVRCWYYRYPQQIGGPIVCLRKGGKICNALVGDNRYHSIFGAAPAAERPCAGQCPGRIDMPGYLSRIREGNIPEAAQILLEQNPFPAVTGRVCPAFCETQCNRSGFDDPVAVHSIERSVGDYILDHPAGYFTPPEKESGRRIAVIGSGPAGLAAAFYLRRSGHRVTVYEKLAQPGGMLLYSIPPFRLPKEVVQKQIQALRGMGIHFETGVSVEGEVAAKIRSDSDAVFAACGAWSSLKPGVPGENAPGVFYALDYLKRVISGETLSLGKTVVVIGGGSVAVDAARTARRTGSEQVHLVCLESRDLSSGDRMQALEWEILEAEEEGIRIHPSLGIREIRTADGKITGIETQKCVSVFDAGGRFNPQYDADSPSLSLDADSIVIAIGQAADACPFAPGDGVFSGGDMAQGPSTVIEAVASARKAVHEIAEFLGEEEKRIDRRLRPEYVESRFDDIPRVQPREIPAEDRIKSIHVEDVLDLGENQILKEACRCVNCGCLAVGPSDLAVALVALNAQIVTTGRTLPAEEFFTPTASSSTVLEPEELIREVRIPKPPKSARQNYLKFTLRKPIDFAIASVACVIQLKDGFCTDARIILGAVAPAPLRAVLAEAVIRGRTIDPENAAEAAEAALSKAHILDKNGYKVQIVRALVKRAILGVSC